jgi:putative hydrolase of the HAD superfamily
LAVASVSAVDVTGHKLNRLERKFDAVLFDVGGVLTTSPAQIMAAKIEEFSSTGITMIDFLPLGLGPLEVDDAHHPFHRLERGEITLVECETLIEELAANAGFNFPVRFPTKEEMFVGLRPVPEMLELVADVRAAGYATAIVSNCIVEWDGWSGVLDSSQVVDVVIDSCRVGLRKPDPRIYELALEQLGGIDPSRSVLVDDFAWNLPSAAALGISTVQVSSHAIAVNELRILLNL